VLGAPAASSAAPFAAVEGLVAGAKVEANYRDKGRWYPGRVGAVNADGSCEIEYDDGEKESHVAPSLVRVLGAPAASSAAPFAAVEGLVAGAKVEANYRDKGRWYPGRVGAVNADGSCEIEYDDGEKESHVAPSLVRVLGAPAAQVPVTDARTEGSRPNMALLGEIGSNPLKRLNKVSAPVPKSGCRDGPDVSALLEQRRLQRSNAWEALCGDTSIAPYRLDYTAIRMSELLGRGKFAAVYHGELRDATGTHAVAVKVAQFKGNDTHQWTPLATPRGSIAPRITAEEVALAAAAKAAAPSDQQEVDAQGRAIPPLVCSEEFHREISALSALSHCPQVVKLVGYTQAPLTVVLELLPEGSLHASLQDPLWQVRTSATQQIPRQLFSSLYTLTVHSFYTESFSTLICSQKRATYRDRVRILSDAAHGLAAMHAALYLHRDIKVQCAFPTSYH
jgi:hypothetical protein